MQIFCKHFSHAVQHKILTIIRGSVNLGPNGYHSEGATKNLF